MLFNCFKVALKTDVDLFVVQNGRYQNPKADRVQMQRKQMRVLLVNFKLYWKEIAENNMANVDTYRILSRENKRLS